MMKVSVFMFFGLFSPPFIFLYEAVVIFRETRGGEFVSREIVAMSR